MKAIDYGTVGVHDLCSLAFDTHYHCVDGGPSYDEWREALESALRKAFIREASVGVGTVRRAGDAPLPEAPQMFVPWETKDGDYDLIPKETT